MREDFLTGCGRPHFCHSFPRRAGNPLAVRTELYAISSVLNGEQLLARLRIPDLQLSSHLASAGQAFAVQAVGQFAEELVMCFPRQNLLTGLGVPYFDI